MSRAMRIAVCPGVLALYGCVLVGSASAQGGPRIDAGGVVNAASYRPAGFPGGHVAGHGIISIFGRNLGPAGGMGAPGFPLPDEFGPLQTRVRINDQLMCRLLWVSDTQINCQLPGGIAGDRIRLRAVTSLGQSEEIEVPFGPNGFGLFTRAQNGRGPLLAQNFDESRNEFRLNAPDDTAQPGQIVVLWGTGLGEVDPPLQAGEPSGGLAPAVVQPEVWVGGVRAQVQYAGRAPEFAGLDQINLVLPSNAPEGCAVPVRLRQGDWSSNIGTIAVNRNRERCRDAFEPIVSGTSFGAVVLATGLGQLGPGQLGPGAGYGGPYPPRPSVFDPPGPNRGPGGGVKKGPGGVGPDGIGPFGVHPGIPPFAGGVMVMNGPGPGPGGPHGLTMTGPDMAIAQFVRVSADASLDIGIPPAATDSCSSYPLGPYGVLDLVRGPVERLDAGDVTIAGPGLAITLSPIATALGPLYAAPLSGPLGSGDYAARGDGGPDVGSFGPSSLELPPLVTVTSSLAPGTQISRSEGLTLAWSGGRAEDLIVVHGRTFQVPPNAPRPILDPMSFPSQAFVCSTTAGSLSFTIPSYVLDALPEGLLTLNVTHMPEASGVARFEAEGLDLGGVFRWLSTTTYLDLELVP